MESQGMAAGMKRLAIDDALIIATERTITRNAKLTTPPLQNPIHSRPQQVQAQLNAPPIALLYLYQEPRKDAHLNAIPISVWRGAIKNWKTCPLLTAWA